MNQQFIRIRDDVSAREFAPIRPQNQILTERVMPVQEVTQRVATPILTTQVENQASVFARQDFRTSILVSNPILIKFFDPTIYLFNGINNALWASGQLVDSDNTINNAALPWMGDVGDSNGFARLDDGVLMENNQSYKVLRTHPKWVGNGTIKGWLPWVKQNGLGTFKAQVGFLNGALGSDGVTFQVWIHYHLQGIERWENIINVRKRYDGQLLDISADLSKWANQSISIELRVDTGPSSGQDWAGWINPRIEIATLENGPVFTSFEDVIYEDRYDSNIKWYLPSFKFTEPTKPFFTISEIGVSGNDKRMYSAKINFEIHEQIPEKVQSAFEIIKASNPNAVLNKIPFNNINYKLTTSYQKSQNERVFIPQYGKFISPNLLEFDISDSVDTDFLKTAYRNIADPDNTLKEFAELSSEATMNVWQKIPNSAFGKILSYNFIKESQNIAPLSKTSISIPCGRASGSLYQLSKDSIVSPIGCRPPWKNESMSGTFYHRINLPNTFDGLVDVFQSYADPQCFIIVPKQYYIGRDKIERGCKPMVSLDSVMDPDERYKNNVYLRFVLLPAISDYEMIVLKTILQQYCPIENGKRKVPVLKYPSDFSINPIFQASALIAGSYELNNSPIKDGAYSLDFKVGNPKDFSPADGALAYKFITGTNPQDGIKHTLTYKLDTANSATSTILLTLNRMAGNIVSIASQTSGQFEVNNVSESAINLKSFRVFDEDSGLSNFIDFKDPINIPAKSKVAITTEQLKDIFGGQDIATFEDKTVYYEVIPDNNLNILTQNDISIDCLQQTILITSNISASVNQIKKIEVEVNIMGINLNLKQILTPINDSFTSINTKPFNLILPLKDYDNDAKKQMQYQVTFHFIDGTQKKSKVYPQNFGSTPTIDLSPSILTDLLV